jgi:hypothetical protein
VRFQYLLSHIGFKSTRSLSHIRMWFCYSCSARPKTFYTSVPRLQPPAVCSGICRTCVTVEGYGASVCFINAVVLIVLVLELLWHEDGPRRARSSYEKAAQDVVPKGIKVIITCQPHGLARHISRLTIRSSCMCIRISERDRESTPKSGLKQLRVRATFLSDLTSHIPQSCI